MSPAAAARIEAPSDYEAFDEFAKSRGWSDGLPLVPPTPERVARYVTAAGLPGDHVIATLPPAGAICTVESLAINAAMAGAPTAAMPLLQAAVLAMADPTFELRSLNVTTGSVTPALIVNGPVRHTLGIPFGGGCMGGADGAAPAIGRALRLVMRNIGGQRIGTTSQSTFGQPGRVTGIVFAEWEERSPWPPLSQRRGIGGSAVTVFGTMGTACITEVIASDPDVLLRFTGRALAHTGSNGYLVQMSFSEVIATFNPVWAEIIGRAYPDVRDVSRILWEYASAPLTEWPLPHQKQFEEHGRVDEKGRVRLVQRPEDMLVTVAGGLGGMHVNALHSWGATRSQTRPVTS